MKIFFLRTEYFGTTTEGGSLAVTRGFTNALLQCGHQAIVAANRLLPLSPSVKQYQIPYSSFFKNLPEVLFLPYNQFSFREAKKIIQKEKPDLLYQRHSIFNYAGALLKRELGIPFILQVEGSEVWVKKNWGKVYLTKPLEWSEQIQFEAADRVVAVSEVLKSQLIQIGVADKKIHVVPNGVDARQYAPIENGTKHKEALHLDKKFVVGYAGTFGRWHGVTVLAKAVKYISERVPNIHFLLIGDGALRGEVETILYNDHTKDFVTLTGMIEHERVPEYLAVSDVLVISAINNPDVPFFQSPIKLFEYMAMQKPIVASRVGQIQDVIVDGQNGLLVDENNPEKLAEKIIMLIENQTLRETIAAKARRDAVEKYSWQENVNQVIRVYEQIKKREGH